MIELHPRAIARYQERVAALTDALRDGNPERAAVVTILRRLVDRIDVTPLLARGQVAPTAHGLIARVVDYATRKQAVNNSAMLMVAGEGFEPRPWDYDTYQLVTLSFARLLFSLENNAKRPTFRLHLAACASDYADFCLPRAYPTPARGKGHHNAFDGAGRCEDRGWGSGCIHMGRRPAGVWGPGEA